METQLNSLVSFLKGFAGAMSKDIVHAYLRPSELERDLSRLSHELGYRGSRVWTLDLPALCKHFEQCLAKGQYVSSGLFLGRLQSKTVKVPVFMRDLYLQVFDNEGKLRNAPNPDAIAAIRALCLTVKKIRLPFTERSLRSEIKDFLRIEADCRSPTLEWANDNLCRTWTSVPHGVSTPKGEGLFPSLGKTQDHDWSGREVHFRDALEEVRQFSAPTLFSPNSAIPADWEVRAKGLRSLQQVADRVAAQFGDMHKEHASELPKHGPGVTATSSKWVDKYAFTHWPTKLEGVFPYDYYGKHDLLAGHDHTREVPLSAHEPPSRLIAVPKTQKGPRLIAAEPACHQWIQQLVWNQLEARLSETPLRHCITFRDQGRNQELARLGSIDGSFATIDLSSASDRLSCWAVERAFRSNWTLLERLHACRTRWLSYEHEFDGFYLELKKFAPMGSSATFPVQTIVYAMLGITAVLLSEDRPVTQRNIEYAARRIQVFGDDIVVPEMAYRYTTLLLELLGLKVNSSKSFSEGNFRESCGYDAFGGHDVTPPYLLFGSVEKPMSSAHSYLAVRNNFYQRGFWNTAYWLDSQISSILKLVPDGLPGVDFLARFSYLGIRENHLKKRFNRTLQRREVQVLHKKSVEKTVDSPGPNRLLKWFIENPSPETNWSSDTVVGRDEFTRPGWTASNLSSEAVMPKRVLAV